MSLIGGAHCYNKSGGKASPNWVKISHWKGMIIRNAFTLSPWMLIKWCHLSFNLLKSSITSPDLAFNMVLLGLRGCWCTSSSPGSSTSSLKTDSLFFSEILPITSALPKLKAHCQKWDSNPRLQRRLRPERSALDRSAILTVRQKKLLSFFLFFFQPGFEAWYVHLLWPEHLEALLKASRCTELCIISWHSPEGLYVRTQIPTQRLWTFSWVSPASPPPLE